MDAALPSPRRYRGLSHDERRLLRRDRLLAAATRVYGETGYRNATVKTVCQAAGLTERYFYESFANSETLLIAAYEAVNRTLIAEIVAVQETAGEAPRARLRAGLSHYFARLQGDPMLARVFLVELPGVSEAADRAHNRALGLFATLLASLYPAGLSDVARRELVVRGVVGAIFGIARHWIGCDYAQPVQSAVEAALLVCEALAPRPAPICGPRT